MQEQRGAGAGGRRGGIAGVLGVIFLVVLGLVAVIGPDPAEAVGPAMAGAQSTGWEASTSPSPAGLTANQLNAVSCPGADDCVAVGYTSTPSGTSPLIETLGTGGWSLTAAAQVPGANVDELQGVSCPSASSCVAVGYSEQKGEAEQTLVETLANGTWSVTTSPDDGSGNNQLTSVACPVVGACVAVGHDQSGGTSRALAEELFAGSWVLTTVPDASSANNVLNGVSCTSAGTCLAVGYYVNAGVERALIETLSASVWAVAASPDQGAGLNELSSISCPTSGSCVSVGTFRTTAGVYQNLIDVLSAGNWAVLPHGPDANGRNNELAGVSCTSATSCMAVGHYNNKGVAQALTVELAHGSWTVVTSPDKGTSTNQLSGVSCPAASTAQCAAVGYFNYVVSALTDVSPQTLTEGWSGSSWAIVAAENALAPDVSVNGVSCSSSTSCAGVGSYESATGARQVFIDGLRNGAWTLASAPPSSSTNNLDSVSCPSSSACVAVGYYATAKTNQALVEKLSAGAWSVMPSPDQGTGYNQLNGVACSSASSCVAVGFSSVGNQERVLIETLANGSWTLTPSRGLGCQLQLPGERLVPVAERVRSCGVRVQR